jgi:hypothetical protein
MIQKQNKIPKASLYFMVGIGCYFVLLLINLIYIPIAWVDEIMDLDPVVNFIEGKGYTSKLWPFSGSSSHFLANMPMRNAPYFIMGKLMGFDIFWIRFPHFIFAVLTAITAYKVFKKLEAPTLLSLFLVLFLLLDKGIYESIRSVRSEIFQLLLMLSCIYFLLKRRLQWLTMLFSALLYLTHPASWVLSIGIAVAGLLQTKRTKGALTVNALLYILPLMLWLHMIDYNIQGVIDQMIAAGKQHSNIDSSILTKLKQHFWDRYTGYIKIQPWVYLFMIIAHIMAMLSVIRWIKGGASPTIITTLFILHSAYWFWVLSAQGRYNPSIIVLSMLVNLEQIPKLIGCFKPKPILLWACIVLQSITFLAINSIGIIEQKERNPYKVQEWLHKSVPTTNLSNKTLVCGASIGAYWLYNYSPNGVVYCEPNYPHQFEFTAYSHLYVLWHDSIVGKKVAQFSLPKKLNIQHPSLNYNGLALYKVTAKELTQFCLYIRNGDPWPTMKD